MAQIPVKAQTGLAAPPPSDDWRHFRYVGYDDYLKGTGGATRLCAAGGRRTLCIESSSKAHEMGWQVFSVDRERLSFQRDRLGVEACTDREGRYGSGCGLLRRQDDSEVGGDCHGRHGLRRRLCQRECSCLSREKRKADADGSRRDRAGVGISITVSRK